ncbi:MAG: hypothetical protein ACLUFI_11255 [Oscillospiraceae bacterium]
MLYLALALFTAAIVAVDQLTKYLAAAHLVGTDHHAHPRLAAAALYHERRHGAEPAARRRGGCLW